MEGEEVDEEQGLSAVGLNEDRRRGWEADAKRDVIDKKTKSEDSEVAYGQFIYMWT